ncbi:hypothetical protein LINPERPRIM_LOCUS1768 [Linum perenne]
MAILLLSSSSSSHSPNPNAQTPTNPKTFLPRASIPSYNVNSLSKRQLLLRTASLCLITLPAAQTLAADPSPKPTSSPFSGIANTRTWFQYFGSGFSIRVPPQFQDMTEPEDYNAGLSLYGDRAKVKTFAARFESADGSEVVSVVIRPTNSLKITFLEAQDVSDLGTLKEAAKIFVPVGSTLFSARTIKIKEEEGLRTYYFYEFGRYDQHVALMAAVNSGKAIIAGAAAPREKWDEDGVKLRSAAISMTVL